MAKRKRSQEEPEKTVILPPPMRDSDEKPTEKSKWRNKQRILFFSNRRINLNSRNFLGDLRKLLPHTKQETKLGQSESLTSINEISKLRNCNKCLFLEVRRKQDLFIHMADIKEGPTMKFFVENVLTMRELKLPGNCLKSSRALLSFDTNFNKPHWALIKEMLTQIFGIPKYHPKSQPFVDHVFSFTIFDEKIWFRHFQILDEEGSLSEIGPRFILTPVSILSGSFGGACLWKNGHFVNPNKRRQLLKNEARLKYKDKLKQQVLRELREPSLPTAVDSNDIYKVIVPNKKLKVASKSSRLK